MDIVNPATQEVISTVKEFSADDVARAFTKAADAQPAWADRDLGERVAILERFSQYLKEHQESLAQVMTAETGKPISQSNNELNGVHDRISYLCKKVSLVTGEEPVHGDEGLAEKLSWEPLGVVGNISAWNFPYFVGSNIFVAALLTGNAVLYKPSEFATLTGIKIGKALHASGVPAEVFQVITGGGATGAALVDQPLGGIFFTGSYATGMKINEAASKRLMKVQLELGGKDPVYVCPDVDVKAAAEGLADGAFYNGGQSCCSVERIYVHEDIHDAFVAHYVETVAGFSVGDPTDASTYLGPLTRGPQIDVLLGQVADAVEKGATLKLGGKRIDGKGNYFEATVLTDVTHEMAVMREESFGPIIGIQKVSSDDEATRLMNDTEFGLTAGVFSKDGARAQAILKQINSGTVYWNCCDRVSPRLPWTGRGHSGIGSTLSVIGLRTFLQPKAWHLRQP